MKLNEVFGGAKWIGAEDKDIFPIIKDAFTLSEIPNGVKINIVGFGGYRLFINGQRVSEYCYLPLNSDFEPRENYPTEEKLAHRIYVDTFDITSLIKAGENTVSVMLGDGWYTKKPSPWETEYSRYGNLKLIYRIFDAKGDILLSDTSAKCTESYVKDCSLLSHEAQDLRGFTDGIMPSGAVWENTVEESAPKSEYYFSDCPRDTIVKRLTPKAVGQKDGAVIYDAGENISGYPVLSAKSDGAEISVIFSEELDGNGGLDMKHSHDQRLTFTAGKAGEPLSPVFVWFGFRYFSVLGDADVIEVCKVHSDVRKNSEFHSDNDLLNWIYGTFINTQLCNMHEGVPSDCPHIERKGYTGDGQLCAPAAMLTLDAREFYKKWIVDISDCQDRISGHVQYTAPYSRNGGGPGGWGIAIVNVPYEYYLRYGDISEAKKLYPQMLKYFDYLEAHSENLLVTGDKPGEWCLGEWCTPEDVILPAPFVNNYFYIKGLMRVIALAGLIGRESDISELNKRLTERKSATRAAYFNTWDGNFLGNAQGANAFALDIGLGDERTKKNFIEHYKKNRFYDTGIFGTEIVTRLLFEYGEADTAFGLLTSEAPEHSFGYWKNTGETTFREYWGAARSHSHPMFGAVVAHFYTYLLGIGQEEGSAGYERLLIKPTLINGLNRLSGSIEVKNGKAETSVEKRNGEFTVSVRLPADTRATVILPNGEKIAVNGETTVKCRL